MTSPQQSGVETLVGQIQESAGPLDLTWQVGLATVLDGDTPGAVTLQMDGDTASQQPLQGSSMLGRLAAGTRIYVLSVPPAGLYPVGYAGLTIPGHVIKRHRRTTSTGASGAETGIVRIDSIPIKAGWLYWVGTGPVILDVSAGGDHCNLQLRYATGGAAATTASTSLQQTQIDIADAASGDSVQVGAFYPPAPITADETLSVILTHDVVAGAGNVFAFGSAITPIELFVLACGPDQGSQGVDL